MNLLPKSYLTHQKLHLKRRRRFLIFTKTFFVVGIVFLIFSFAPSIWYSIAQRVDDFSLAILQTAKNAEESNLEQSAVIVPEWQPVFDSKLPRETTIKISEIGVDAVINEATLDNYEEALRKGIWRVSDFGTPADKSKPMILAAHRFGYLEWSNLYRRKNSFYNLPKLKTGDQVEIVYKQRKYVYEIYADSRGDEITDYSADLILYTCETLNSKVRIFKYARLLKI